MQVRAAVGQRDHLREGVGPLGAAQQRGMADLRGEAAGGTAGAERGGEERGHCCGCWWHLFLCCGGLMGCPSVASMLLASFGRGGELAEMERASLAEDQTDGPRDAMRLKCMMYVV